MSVLIDTNILLRSAQPTHPLYPTTTHAVSTLLKRNETVFFCIEGLLTLLPDTPSIYPEWKRIVSAHGIQGIKVFDARLIAVANTYGVGNILTFNAGDFRRFSPVAILNPTAFVV